MWGSVYTLRCVCVRAPVCPCTCLRRSEKSMAPARAEVTAGTTPDMGSGSSARAASAFRCWVSSPVPVSLTLNSSLETVWSYLEPFFMVLSELQGRQEKQESWGFYSGVFRQASAEAPAMMMMLCVTYMCYTYMWYVYTHITMYYI